MIKSQKKERWSKAKRKKKKKYDKKTKSRDINKSVNGAKLGLLQFRLVSKEKSNICYS
jgi:hypothetical protein